MTAEAATMPLDIADIAAEPAVAARADVERRNKLVIYLLLVSTFVVILNETLMIVALPVLMDSLKVTAGAAQWLTTAFLLTMAVVIPVTGFLLQRLNTRPVFLLAMSLFSLGTAVAIIAPNLPVLVVARVIQASGTAIMMPLLMTTVMTLVPPEQRGRMMGNLSIVISVAPALGPFVSGVILQYLDWRFLFILVLPIALAALALGMARIQNVSTPRYAPLDILSVGLSVLGFGGLVYGLTSLGEAATGHQLMPTWIPLTIGGVALVAFVLRQLQLQAKDKALLDLRTFASFNFTISLVMFVVLMLAMFGTFVLLPIYLQNVLGLSTLTTGALLFPGGITMGLLGPVVGRLYDRVGPTILVVPASIVVSGVLWAMTMLTPVTPVEYIVAGHVVFSIALAFLFTPLFTSSLGSVKPQLYSHGSAILGSTQQVAGAAGVALFVALMTSQSVSLAAGGASQVDALSGGITTGFFAGAVISLFAIVAAFFVRKPADQGMGGHGH